MKLHRFYFDFVDNRNEENSVYVYAYNEKDAVKFFKAHIAEEYNFGIEEYTLEDEGEIDFPEEDVFFDKYDVIESREESGFIDKSDDNWEFIKKFADDNPDKIWSVCDCGEIICGLHFIDVNGYYMTVQSGELNEVYGYFEGMVA